MDYLVFDIETTYGKSYGRVGNRWDKDFGLCSVGWVTGKGDYDAEYCVEEVAGTRVGLRPGTGIPFPCLDNISILVGHNIKFDLLWYWDHPEIIAFFKRGGKIWDTAYGEFLLSGQLYNQNAIPDFRINLKQCAKRRKLSHQKQDVVKALWQSGMRTEDISEAVLMEYMKYDVLTTEDLFKAQIKQGRDQGQIKMIQNRMDGMLCTAEMEYNGMRIDLELAMEQKAELEIVLAVLHTKLEDYVPELPEECTFKWGAWRHLSALLFGGEIKYQSREYSLDADGNKQYYKKTIKVIKKDKNGDPVVYKSGKRIGEIVTKNLTINDFERGAKTRLCDKFFTLERKVTPSTRWIAKSGGFYDDDPERPKYYQTNKKVIKKLKAKGVDIVDDLLEYRKIDKNLGTYYIREKKGKTTGMLTNIQPVDNCVHGHLNHTVAVTGRLSGSEPNLQNLNKKGDIKKTFVSRFKGGVVAELDYSQLEVVTQYVNSNDKNLGDALMSGKCFHCEWASFITGESYENIYQWAKIDEQAEWVKHRQDAKPVNFGEAYGAGVNTLCEESGLDADTIIEAINRRKERYPELYGFHERVMGAVLLSRTRTTQRTDNNYIKHVGYWQSPTTTIYHFLEKEAPEFMWERGEYTTFSPTIIKNYPSQGLGGEIMQTMKGIVWRQFIKHGIQDDCKLILTVHDSLYVDFRTEALAKKYLPLIAAVLEDVCWYFNKCFKAVNWDIPFPIDAKYGQNIKECTERVPERDSQWVEEYREAA